jgi:hypothetical protein
MGSHRARNFPRKAGVDFAVNNLGLIATADFLLANTTSAAVRQVAFGNRALPLRSATRAAIDR